jgi:hypothetical protein
MRRLPFLAACLALLAPCLRAADVTFVRVWPQWQTADPFLRISEFFTGRENPGERTILRTQADNRAGFYFLIRVKNPGPLITGTHFTVAVIIPGHPDPKVFTFPTNVPAGGKVYQLGLTGADWPGKRIYPLAWQVELLDAEGRALAAQQSFLWSKPN